MQAMNVGVVEALSIFGAQAYGDRDFKRLLLFLKQALLSSTGIFFLVTLPASFFLEQALVMYGISPLLAKKSHELVKWTLPGMYLRLINDSLKAFILCQGHMSQLGMANIAVYLPFIPFSYFVIVKLQLGVVSFGLCVLFYESLVLLMCLFMLKFAVDLKIFRLNRSPNDNHPREDTILAAPESHYQLF